jgi:hypothetical protein
MRAGRIEEGAYGAPGETETGSNGRGVVEKDEKEKDATKLKDCTVLWMLRVAAANDAIDAEDGGVVVRVVRATSLEEDVEGEERGGEGGDEAVVVGL